MEQLIKEVRQLLSSLAARLSQLLSEAPAGSLQISGVLGLAAVLYGLYHFQGPARAKGRVPSSDRLLGRSGGEAGASTDHTLRRNSAASPAAEQLSDVGPSQKPMGGPVSSSEGRGLSWAIRSRLPGVTSLTVSAPGVLLEECTTSELQEAATLKADAAEILQEISHICSVYVITQVDDDTGEATCRGALEAVDLIGYKPGQIPPHRLLFCSSLVGKVSIVRQLEPQLHIDSHPKTIDDLKRFIKLVYINPVDSPHTRLSIPNVAAARSLKELFAVGQ